MVLALNTALGIAGTVLTGFVLVPVLGLAGSLGALAFVAVIEQSRSRGSFRRLYIQGVSNTGDALPSLRCMRLQALTPLLVHPGEAKSALVIGFGTGITSGALLTDPGLERRLSVELLEPVVAATALFDGNFRAGGDPRLETRIADGRHELMRSEERFDLSTLEPPPPAAAGVVNLYSRDFYELARERLTDGGILAQWWPITTQNDEDAKSLVRSMLDVFPQLSLWTTELHEMMRIGSMQPLSLDFSRISKRFQTPGIATALREDGVRTPEDLISTYVTDRKGLQIYVGNALPVTDDRPRIEYAGWVRPFELTWVLPQLLEVRTPPPIAASVREKARIQASYRRLSDFYEIAVLGLHGEREGWEVRVGSFLSNTEPNA